MNFEKLSNKKFESFKENILDNASLVVGGKSVRTKRGGSADWNDSLDNTTSGQGDITQSTLGKTYDFYIDSRAVRADNNITRG